MRDPCKKFACGIQYCLRGNSDVLVSLLSSYIKINIPSRSSLSRIILPISIRPNDSVLYPVDWKISLLLRIHQESRGKEQFKG